MWQGKIIYTYDANGNLTQKAEGTSITKYAWTVRDKLAVVTLPDSSTVTHLYDGDGNRLQRLTSGGGVVRYINDLSGISQVLMEKNAQGATLATFTYGNDLIKMRRGTADSYFHYDGLGSVRQVTDATKTVTDTYIYEAFGSLIASSGTTENTRKFTGEEFDSSTGLQYLRARYYDPSVGRFISRDLILLPMIHFGGSSWMLPHLVRSPQMLHPYVYVANNPVNFIDPTGLLMRMPRIPRRVPIPKKDIAMWILERGVSLGKCWALLRAITWELSRHEQEPCGAELVHEIEFQAALKCCSVWWYYLVPGIGFTEACRQVMN